MLLKFRVKKCIECGTSSDNVRHEYTDEYCYTEEREKIRNAVSNADLQPNITFVTEKSNYGE